MNFEPSLLFCFFANSYLKFDLTLSKANGNGVSPLTFEKLGKNN